MPPHERYLKGVLCILMRMQRGQAAQGQLSPCLNSAILFSNLTYFFSFAFFFCQRLVLCRNLFSVQSQSFLWVSDFCSTFWFPV